jgi:hypothetical protein
MLRDSQEPIPKRSVSCNSAVCVLAGAALGALVGQEASHQIRVVCHRMPPRRGCAETGTSRVPQREFGSRPHKKGQPCGRIGKPIPEVQNGLNLLRVNPGTAVQLQGDVDCLPGQLSGQGENGRERHGRASRQRGRRSSG